MRRCNGVAKYGNVIVLITRSDTPSEIIAKVADALINDESVPPSAVHAFEYRANEVGTLRASSEFVRVFREV
jgi:hypothetical protein